jgi:hypothetical protein
MLDAVFAQRSGRHRRLNLVPTRVTDQCGGG